MNKKGQMKIQEMAFVLVAIVVFFAMVALVYFSIRLSSLKTDVTTEREEGARDLARKLADIPEFSWAGCSGCVDADKLLALRGRAAYRGLWDVDYIMVERVYPNGTSVECSIANYPDCRTITLVNRTTNYGIPSSAFVALCRYEPEKGGYTKCELGKIYVAARAIE